MLVGRSVGVEVDVAVLVGVAVGVLVGVPVSVGVTIAGVVGSTSVVGLGSGVFVGRSGTHNWSPAWISSGSSRQFAFWRSRTDTP